MLTVRPPEAHPQAEAVLAVAVVAAVLFGGMVSVPRVPARAHSSPPSVVAEPPPLPRTVPTPGPVRIIPEPQIVPIPPADLNNSRRPAPVTPSPGASSPTPSAPEPARPAIPLP